ncbi:hypothetical protein NDU88_004332 [Pleurodeles waltl]|uniref:Uncharacterized protein n=1 Tax=Pleurodeles waltl TaxID=8319 RepID=A0AAV7SIK2_PLEWA|nr:hypothetical protein NDU88_004332 [Pleurodeles waltl]
MADKTEGVCQTCMAKEGSDGHVAGKRLTGGSIKIGCKVSARAGTVKDGEDQSRGVEPDNKARDRTQNKLQAIITDFLTYGDQGSGAVNPILLSKDVPTTMEEALGGEKGLHAAKGLLRAAWTLIDHKIAGRGKKGIEREKERTITGEDVVQDLAFETTKAENDGKNIDLSKDGGDQFYSLMEESEAVSSGYDLSGDDGRFH